MNSHQPSKWISCLLMVSVLFVWGAWVSRGRVREFVDAIIDRVYLPALSVAIELSPDPHNMSGVLLFAAYVVQTFLMLLVIVGGIAAVTRLKRRRP
jgi:hypothetical protein